MYHHAWKRGFVDAHWCFQSQGSSWWLDRVQSGFSLCLVTREMKDCFRSYQVMLPRVFMEHGPFFFSCTICLPSPPHFSPFPLSMSPLLLSFLLLLPPSFPSPPSLLSFSPLFLRQGLSLSAVQVVLKLMCLSHPSSFMSGVVGTPGVSPFLVLLYFFLSVLETGLSPLFFLAKRSTELHH